MDEPYKERDGAEEETNEKENISLTGRIRTRLGCFVRRVGLYADG